MKQLCEQICWDVSFPTFDQARVGTTYVTASRVKLCAAPAWATVLDRPSALLTAPDEQRRRPSRGAWHERDLGGFMRVAACGR